MRGPPEVQHADTVLDAPHTILALILSLSVTQRTWKSLADCPLTSPQALWDSLTHQPFTEQLQSGDMVNQATSQLPQKR